MADRKTLQDKIKDLTLELQEMENSREYYKGKYEALRREIDNQRESEKNMTMVFKDKNDRLREENYGQMRDELLFLRRLVTLLTVDAKKLKEAEKQVSMENRGFSQPYYDR